MPLDPGRVAETKAWFAKAAGDLRAATHARAADPPLLDDMLFHCQQTAEKALKGFLCWHDRSFRKTHSLEELGEQCLAMDPALRSLVDRATPLTEYASRFRYPGEPTSPDLEEAEGALAIARAVFEGILARLPADVRP